jgi:hypothetical protein
VLHEQGVIHRDLKPDNVLVTGPIDDETPKLADCGIARVAGMQTTIQAATPAYCGPEQMLHVVGRPNPLVGTWTDVHAAAAVVWCVLAGEQWCRGDTDLDWHVGQRRSLRTGPRVHRGFRSSESLLDKLDAVLRQAAAQQIPAAVWANEAARSTVAHARDRYPGMFTGPERFATIDEFARALVPLLQEAAARWKAQAAEENQAVTAFRPTQMLSIGRLQGSAPLCSVREHNASSIVGTRTSVDEAVASQVVPGCVVFQPDGKVLARVGSRLLYFVQDVPHKVRVSPDRQPLVDATRWIVRGPRGGFALVGPAHILLVRGGNIDPLALPGGGESSPISAVVGDGRVFGVATEGTEDSGGPELWLSEDGANWMGPEPLPLGGIVRAIAYGPYGYLVVGAMGKRGRALFLGLDGQVVVFTKEVQQRGPLLAALCSADREGWGAGDGFVLKFDRGVAVAEQQELGGLPMAFGLDPGGIPWLVTTHVVARRHVEAGVATWRAYYKRQADRPSLVAIGFTPEGARVLDSAGGTVHIKPHDVERWSSVGATALASA